MNVESFAASELKSESILYRVLNRVERVGNLVPNPAILFVGLAAIVVAASWIVSTAGISVHHPATGETIRSVNLLSVEGLHRILTGLVTNFTSFAPLGTVLVAPFGLAVAEASGLIRTSLRLLVMSSPKKLLTVVVVFAGVMSHTASDIGYVLLIPFTAKNYAICRNTHEVNEVTVPFRPYSVRASALLSTSLMHSF